MNKYWDKQIQLSFDHQVHDFLLVQFQLVAALTVEDLLGPHQKRWRLKECWGRSPL